MALAVRPELVHIVAANGDAGFSTDLADAGARKK